jgi:hypothetical protein
MLQRWPTILLFLGCALSSCHAQVSQFLPEVDTYVGLTDHTQFWFQAKETREDQAPTQAEIGPSFDFFLKPIVKLSNATLFDLDQSKQRLFVVSLGFRSLPSPGNPTENRILMMGTFNLPLRGKILLADRNRVEVNFTNGDATWRYRNRVTLQRTITVHSYHPSLNASAECFYNSRYDKWSTTALYAGAIFPIRSKVELNPYYEHQNSTGRAPNQQIKALGVILNLFFRNHE